MFGYIILMREDKNPRQLIKSNPKGRVTIGRPRKMYMVRGDSMKKWNGYN